MRSENIMRILSSSARVRQGRRAKKVLLAAAVLFIGAFGLNRVGRADPDALARIDGMIESWHFAEAKAGLEAIDSSRGTVPRAHFLRGKLSFFRGDHGAALSELRLAIEGARAEIDWKILRDRVIESERAFVKLTGKAEKGGRFLYRYQQGPDALLIPYADAALQEQLKALGALLQDMPDYMIEIDILPDIRTLAQASGLSVEQIDRTGTVGVTKYGRVMIISPRALATGYPWIDTLAHELTHLAITRVSRNRAPIWLHEGLAKLLETQWREISHGVLTPEEAYILDRASREGRLIPLRRFHPSVAHLPNQEDAALAYAQVLSFMRYLNDRLGEDWITALLRRMGDGQTMDQALKALSKHPLRRLYQWWKLSVSGKRQTPVPAVGLMKRRFKRGKATGERGLESLLSPDVRKHLRVGDLLRLRGHIKAASREYKRANSLAESPSPKITDRLAACWLDLGQPAKVISLLPRIAELYPAHSTIFVQLGIALARENKKEEALSALERANAINPFHPAVHCELKDIYLKLGKKREAEQEGEYCGLLASHAEKKSP
jgi:tetratricopeptide (TPR) repeat protein